MNGLGIDIGTIFADDDWSLRIFLMQMVEHFLKSVECTRVPSVVQVDTRILGSSVSRGFSYEDKLL